MLSGSFQGGIAHICVYTKGLVENVIVGDELAALLRIVAVSGSPGDTIEVSFRHMPHIRNIL